METQNPYDFFINHELKFWLLKRNKGKKLKFLHRKKDQKSHGRLISVYFCARWSIINKMWDKIDHSLPKLAAFHFGILPWLPDSLKCSNIAWNYTSEHSSL